MKSVDGLSSSEAPTVQRQERLRALMSVLADGEASPAEMDELLHPDTDLRECHGDWVTYQFIGDLMRGAAQASAPWQPTSQLVQRVSQRLQEDVLHQPEGVLPLPRPEPGPAANDAVFRWKLVAGLASLVAVVSVAWTSLEGLTSSDTQTGSGVVAQVGPTEPVREVLVQTPLGAVARDPQLEQLLAQHRQFGGVSAFQMPTGFIRNATYETTGSR